VEDDHEQKIEKCQNLYYEWPIYLKIFDCGTKIAAEGYMKSGKERIPADARRAA